MKQWYCIFKGRSDYGWIKLFSDIVVAPTKKDARLLIEEDLGKVFPIQILRKDQTPDSILLAIYEITEDNEYVKDFFSIKKCKICGIKFRQIDRYNIENNLGVNGICSEKCQAINYQSEKNNFINWNYAVPVIYKITQKSTGKMYIGQTIRSFTLRWWEHIKSIDENKFHKILRESKITDWLFQIIEEVNLSDLTNSIDKNKRMLEREDYWIQHYDSINTGFNSTRFKEEKFNDN